MGTLHHSDSGVGWIKRRFADLERQIREQAAARRLEAAIIGKGGIRVRGGDIFLEDANGNVLWKASEDPVKTRGGWAADSGLSIPNTWSVLGYASMPVPAGFIGHGHFQVNVSVGDTMTGTDGSDLARRDGGFTPVGSVSVQPVFRWRFTDNSTSAWIADPDTAIASPESRIAVASSFWAANFGMTNISGHEGKTVSHIELGVNGVRSFGTETGTDGNWHVAASAIFKRGGELS